MLSVYVYSLSVAGISFILTVSCSRTDLCISLSVLVLIRDCEEVVFLYNPETVDYALQGGYRNCVNPKLSQTENR